MTEFIDVDTGEVKVTSEPVVLRVMAIGSCVVVAAFDRGKKIGGLAHIMLPGRSLESESKDKTKYAEDAVDELLEKLKNLGVRIEDLEISLVGGADLLGESYICELIVNSILDYLEKLRIIVLWKSLRGTQVKAPEDQYFYLGKIMVVDDGPEMRVVLTTFLKMRGFDVKDISSGDQAVMEIKIDKPSLVLLDERMPGMDGLVALKKIKEIDSAVRVVMLTAIEDEDIIKEAMGLGALDYITKPCDLEKLEALILSILIPRN